MIIDFAKQHQIPFLRDLWKQAFNDTDQFLDVFFGVAFDFKRCRCVSENNEIISALYWFDCLVDGKKIAYLYAIATKKQYRKKGYFTLLINDVKNYLIKNGYYGAILVPSDFDGLRALYNSVGFTVKVCVNQIVCTASQTEAVVTPITADEYFLLRDSFLPRNAVVQKKENQAFLSAIARFAKGDNFILSYAIDNGVLNGELLGDVSVAPNILKSLNAKSGTFITVGSSTPYALFNSFNFDITPSYFGLAFN